MVDLLKKVNQKPCVCCNFINCICPQNKNFQKQISAIKEVNIKRKKWVTNIYGNVEKSTFIYLKKILGTGGTFEDKFISLRGKIQNRVKSTLLSLNYQIINANDKSDNSIA